MADFRRCVMALLLCFATRAHAQVRASGKPVPAKDNVIEELRRKHLVFPVAGFSLESVSDNFSESRGGNRVHRALDISAARGTPVVSMDSGRVIKVYKSKAGGLTLYAADACERFIYYYAHLDRYRDGIRKGMPLMPGDTIGYVGTTGNAPANTPHLHFAILRSTNIEKWWQGTPVNPYMVFKSLKSGNQ